MKQVLKREKVSQNTTFSTRKTFMRQSVAFLGAKCALFSGVRIKNV